MTASNPATILVVDDHTDNITLLVDVLSIHGYSLRSASNGHDALKIARSELIDLILLDVNMPGMDGYTVCETLKADDDLESIPVIFVSVLDDPTVKMKGFSVGGVDYIQKPFQPEELFARVATHLELRRKQREVEVLQQQEIDYLKQVSQLKDQMVKMVSHDIKNPLSIIMSAVSVLQVSSADYFQQTPRAAEYVDLIRQGAEKIQALVRDILDTSHGETIPLIHRESVSLTGYLKHCVDEQQFTAQSNQIDLQFTPPDSDITVQLSAERFSQVIQNLLTNAIKYTPRGGKVELSTEIKSSEVLIRVRDTGIGIPAEDLPHLFDKFYRVQRTEHLQRSGSGLGLAIVKTLVEQHGGQVWVESQLGHGSRFTVSLPR